MNSFHHSRGRILFEVLCGLGISASLAGAWLQTDASALLAAAALSLVCGLVRLSDISGRKAAPEAVAQEEPAATVETVETVEEAQPAVELKAIRTKAPRKKAAPRAKPPKETPTAEPVAVEEPEALPEELAALPLEPLFEPQPFARQQHAVFGRKARFG